MSGEALFDDRPYALRLDLAERFIVPPFSVIDARTGRWAELRRWWDALDIDGTAGRGVDLTFSSSTATDDTSRRISAHGGTSAFSPVLCELIYRWWSPSGGVVLDPFAGGATRGVVAGVLGREYHGVELSEAQVDANEDTAYRLAGEMITAPRWYRNDSVKWQPNVAADAIVSCPPYGSLERYSSDPADLSTLKWPEFQVRYREAIGRSVDRLRPDRFAVFVVGNYREGKKTMRDLVGLTVDAFGSAGCDYYGDLVYVHPAPSAGLRVSSHFERNRKVAMVHQNVVVFVKGDPFRAAEAIR